MNITIMTDANTKFTSARWWESELELSEKGSYISIIEIKYMYETKENKDLINKLIRVDSLLWSLIIRNCDYMNMLYLLTM